MPTAEFQTFGGPHLVAMGLTLALPILLAGVARRAASTTVAATIGYLLAGALLINEVTHWGYRLAQLGVGGFVQQHLPLHVCGVTVFATAATLIFRNRRTYEIAYFWGVVGSSNAVITPNVDVGFPEYRFFQYFITHSGIVVGVLYATWGLKMRPTLGGLWRAFIGVNVFAAGVGAANLLLDANYMYLSEPPLGTVSPFFFAPWPWYIPILDAVALGLFFIALCPFLAADRWRSRTAPFSRAGRM